VVSFPIAFHFFDITVLIFAIEIFYEFSYQGKDPIISDPFLICKIFAC
jgi:hypothetical protein